ncbi:MAG: HAD family hydrolase [Halodesulfurarchaeum sp.]
MAYEAIVFDMDGVLLEGYHTDRDIYRRAATETLVDFDTGVGSPPEELVDPADAAVVRRLCEEYDVQADSFWGYREHASTTMENEEIEAGGREPFDDVEVLQELAEKHRLGIVSNNRQGTVRFVVGHFGWDAFVEGYRGRRPTLEDFDRMKPEPSFLDSALEDLQVPASETIFVGDRLSDVVTAREVGTDSALLVRDGEPPTGEADPTMQISSLLELLELS